MTCVRLLAYGKVDVFEEPVWGRSCSCWESELSVLGVCQTEGVSSHSSSSPSSSHSHELGSEAQVTLERFALEPTSALSPQGAHSPHPLGLGVGAGGWPREVGLGALSQRPPWPRPQCSGPVCGLSPCLDERGAGFHWGPASPVRPGPSDPILPQASPPTPPPELLFLSEVSLDRAHGSATD